MRLVDAWSQCARGLKACSVLVLAIFVPWTMIALLAFLLSYLLGADRDFLKDESIVLGWLLCLNGISLFVFIVGSLRINLPARPRTAARKTPGASGLKAQKA